MLHKLMLKLPVLGEIVISGDLARSAGALGSLTQVGLPLPEAMEVASETAGNEVIRAALVKVRLGLLAGEGLAGPLEEANLFPVSFVQTIKVAEDTGTLDKNLVRMSDFYQLEATEKVKSMVALLEPLSTVVVALMVGFVALAVIMPMYAALSVVGGE
jgi:type IV pilus assembly protein PilC